MSPAIGVNPGGGVVTLVLHLTQTAKLTFDSARPSLGGFFMPEEKHHLRIALRPEVDYNMFLSPQNREANDSPP